MWNLDRAAEAAPECVVGLVRFLVEAIGRSVQGAVLQVLEGTAMEAVGAAFGDDGHIADLRKLRVIVELRYFKFADQFRGVVDVSERAVLAHIDGGRAIHGILNLGWRSAADRDIPMAVLLNS